MKIAVISDIHSAADHFRDALDAARTEGFDRLVILGDLFTYGPDPVETYGIATEAAERDDAVVIKGNHDELYLVGAPGAEYRAPMPEWIRETVEWTSAQLNEAGVDSAALDRLPWQDEWQQDELLFSHANPFGAGDWTYLRDSDSIARAAVALSSRSLRCGVFGHVHRFRTFADEDGTIVATVGSIGQPRDKAERFSQWAMVTTSPEIAIEQRRVGGDWGATVQKIRNSRMSAATRERLCQFYQ